MGVEQNTDRKKKISLAKDFGGVDHRHEKQNVNEISLYFIVILAFKV